jgi:hypothetical protein
VKKKIYCLTNTLNKNIFEGLGIIPRFEFAWSVGWMK